MPSKTRAKNAAIAAKSAALPKIPKELLDQFVQGPMPESVWSAAPRPFPDEAFGGWFGRVAGRYGIAVDELAAAADVRLNLNPEGSGRLAAAAPASRFMSRLADLCRLGPEDVLILNRPVALQAGCLSYCYQCLVLNPRDVFSPYWKDAWIDGGASLCREHPRWVGRVSPTDMQQNRNVPRLLRLLERRWRRIERKRRIGS